MVTFIIVVIALLLSSFLILTHVHKRFRLQTNHIIELTKLVDRGFYDHQAQSYKGNDTLTIPLMDEDYKSLRVHKEFWGVFEKVYSEAQIKNKKLAKVAIVGQQGQKSKIALFLNDNRKPLVVVGITKITGTALLPERGVKTGHISGQPYYGTRAVYGEIKESKKFPQLDNRMRQYITLLSRGEWTKQTEVQYFDLNAKKKVVNSFHNNLLLAYSPNEIMLTDMELSGHIIVHSNTKITVDESSLLTDIILIAPEIEIKDNVKGTFQALATGSILVSDHVRLGYPSALVLISDYEKEQDHFLKMTSKSQIKGSLLCLGKTTADNYQAQLEIESDVIIEGEVYCEQNLELRGTVYGSVYTNNFIVREDGTTYQNHLFNAEINIDKMSEEYVGLSLDKSPKQVMKWLY
ncbi:hypothetical protein [Psychroserpens sp. SPM9]|uniref:hypothetical protein n=1 Tax=Psychroserpens sp. SPM9 TaxID=2975598 RepID=UPI0021A598A3|nr:hypothetical protein [Psychroserpens sp. SPM9]MDG5490652.1 hypothetical protein [Psychroserpens sp. SPM9]